MPTNRRRRPPALFALAALSAACGAPAASPTSPSSPAASPASATTPSGASIALPTPARTLVALSKGDHTLAIVSPADLHVLAREPVGPDPHEVVASADGKTAYVSNTGSGRFHEIDVVDLIAQKSLAPIDTGALLGPHGLAFAGGKVWFTAEGAKAVAHYDPAAARIDWVLGTGQNRTHMIYVAPDEKHVYATNVDSGSVSLLENVLRPPPPPPPGGAPPPGMAPPEGHPPPPRADWDQTVVQLTRGVEGFDVTADGRELWTASAQDGNVSVIDLGTKKVTATIDARAFGANRLKLTPDGKLALVSTMQSGELVVLDAPSRKPLKRVPVGRGAAGLLVDADGARAFVSCTGADYVAVVDLKTLQVTAHVDVGKNPDGLAWAVRP